MKNATSYHLFPRLVSKDTIESQSHPHTDRISIDPKPRPTLLKVPLIQQNHRPGSITSERVVKQFPKFCVNSQQLNIIDGAPQSRLSESIIRNPRASIIVKHDSTLDKSSIFEATKRPVHHRKLKSIHNWAPMSLDSLSPAAEASTHCQLIRILPLESTKKTMNYKNTLKAEVLLSCPTQYVATEESPAGSLDHLDDKTPITLSDNQSQTRMDNLETSMSNSHSQYKLSNNTLEGSAESVEEEAQLKSLSSRTNLDNAVADLSKQFSKQSVKARRKLKIVKKVNKDDKKTKRKSPVPKIVIENEEQVLQGSSTTIVQENNENINKEEEEVVQREDDANAKEIVNMEDDYEGFKDKGAKDTKTRKRKTLKKEFKIKRQAKKISIRLQNSYYKEDNCKPIAGKKEAKGEETLFFLNESSSSDDNMFIEYVKTVKRNDKLRSLQ